MSFGNFHIDFVGLGQVLLAVAAVIAAWRGRNSAKEKAENAKQDQNAGT